jgi:undecaprenyl-phosphate 4-deoxy-4-formamido-L-arabinose transferase
MSAAPYPPISVVVPVYNSEQTLGALVDRLLAVLTPLTPQLEIVLVNDGSRDGSWQTIEKLAAKVPQVRGIDLMRNFGQHNALLAGIRAAVGTLIITLDDDLQNPPEEIPKLLARLDDGVDVVYGCPEKPQHGLWRNLASALTKLVLQEGMGAEIARKVSSFRLFRSLLRAAFVDYRSPFLSIDVLLSWATGRFAAVDVRHESRAAGTSQYSLGKLVLHALNMMTGFTSWPLRLASIGGFGLTLVGVGLLAYVLIRYLIQGGSVPGFPFLAATISFFSGAQLFALGLIGEYLSRVHFRLMERPTYAVRSRTSGESPG